MHPIKDATKEDEVVTTVMEISIHAPYKECNLMRLNPRQAIYISIHAPYKGCNRQNIRRLDE